MTWSLYNGLVYVSSLVSAATGTASRYVQDSLKALADSVSTKFDAVTGGTVAGRATFSAGATLGGTGLPTSGAVDLISGGVIKSSRTVLRFAESTGASPSYDYVFEFTSTPDVGSGFGQIRGYLNPEEGFSLVLAAETAPAGNASITFYRSAFSVGIPSDQGGPEVSYLNFDYNNVTFDQGADGGSFILKSGGVEIVRLSGNTAGDVGLIFPAPTGTVLLQAGGLQIACGAAEIDLIGDAITVSGPVQFSGAVAFNGISGDDVQTSTLNAELETPLTVRATNIQVDYGKMTLGSIDGTGRLKLGVGSTEFMTLQYDSLTTNATLTGSTGTKSLVSLTPTINQSGSAGYQLLHVNPTHTATGSGTKYLLRLQVGGVDRDTVDSNGSEVLSPTNTLSTGTGIGLKVASTVNQTSAAAYDDIQVDRTNTAPGSGQQNLLNLKLSGTSKWRADTSGNVTQAGYTSYPTNVWALLCSDGSSRFYFSNLGTTYIKSGSTATGFAARNSADTEIFAADGSGNTTCTGTAGGTGAVTVHTKTITINQSGAGSYYGERINVAHTATGSGTKIPFAVAVNGTDVFSVTSLGSVNCAGIASSGTMSAAGFTASSGSVNSNFFADVNNSKAYFDMSTAGIGFDLTNRTASNIPLRINCPAGQSTSVVLARVNSVMVFEVNKDGAPGFNGTTPIAKQTLAASATDLASVIALANDIRTKLINTGLMG